MLCGSVLSLQALIENDSAEPIDSAVGGLGATSDSRSLVQLCQAPPIPAYEKLLTIDEIIAEGAELRDCETAADLETKSAELEQTVALVLELRSATLNRKEDLCNAQTAYVKAAKLATQKAAREKAKLEQKKNDGDKPSGTSFLLVCCCGRSYRSCSCQIFNLLLFENLIFLLGLSFPLDVTLLCLPMFIPNRLHPWSGPSRAVPSLLPF